MKKRTKPRWFTIEQRDIIHTALDVAIGRWEREVADTEVVELRQPILEDLKLFKRALEIFEAKTKHIKKHRKRRRKKVVKESPSSEEDKKLVEWLESGNQYY